jgi:hypothetical protein
MYNYLPLFRPRASVNEARSMFHELEFHFQPDSRQSSFPSSSQFSFFVLRRKQGLLGLDSASASL